MATASESFSRFLFGSPVLAERDVRSASRPATALLGRLLIAPLFILSGVGKFAAFGSTVEYVRSAGIPFPKLALAIAAVVEILGGLSILTGFLTRLGALVLLVYLIPTTLLFHHFWTFAGDDRTVQMVNFLKNLGIMGGLALLIAYGPGRYAIDAALHRPSRTSRILHRA